MNSRFLVYCIVMRSNVRYFEDMACRKPKLLGTGYKNLYVVRIHYTHRDNPEKVKDIVLPYAKYKLASDRYDIETSTRDQPEIWLLDEIKIYVETYLDSTLAHSEDMMRVKFGTRNLYNKYARNRIGEVMP